jgi:lipopolysaccharide export system protein LptA
MKIRIFLLLLAWAGLTPVLVHAEKLDRDKPVNLEADRMTIDDARKQHILEGNVQLVQGTLVIRCEKLVVSQDAEGFQKGVATGGSKDGLAHFRQKREGKDEYVDGEAERIVYDGKADIAEFFVRAYVKSGSDEVRGEYIRYDGYTEKYVVTSNPEAKTSAAAGSGDQRVRAVIQPKSRSNANAAPAANAGAPTGASAPRSDTGISKTHQDE